MTLIDRLSKLDVPDREVDALIVKHFGLENERPYWLHRFTRSTPMHLTASVDAAIALAERVLPGWMWTLYPTYSEVRYTKSPAKGRSAHGANTAIALCIAILRAKEDSDAGN